MLNVSNNPQTTAELHPQGQTRIKAAAELIGVHHQTLRRWWKAQPPKFPKPTNVHGILLFKNSDLIDFVESQHAPAKSNQGDNVPAQGCEL